MDQWTPKVVEIKLCEAMQMNIDLAIADGWLQWLSSRDRKLVVMRSQNIPWKIIARKQSMDTTTAWRHYKRSISKICRRLQAIDDDITILL